MIRQGGHRLSEKIMREQAINRDDHGEKSPRVGGRLMSQDEDEVAGVRLTHPDKVLYPDQGLTKRELAEYLAAVARYMLPLAKKHPLSLVRCPDGIGDKCFFQKHL